jgi:hypothetical protein
VAQFDQSFVVRKTSIDLKKQALINDKAKAADRDPQFSQRIRAGVIVF